jgi:preprotein translocase subunit SecA
VSTNLVHQFQAALKAKELYKRDKDYIIQHGEVKIVDEFTGRILEGRRWSEGLHQAVEAKEGVKIKEENQTLATITLQNYFRMYEKLAGMTGTATTESAELMNTYDLQVVPIPTNQPVVRDDGADLIYKSELGKFDAVVEDLAGRYEAGQPVLVGTVSVAKSEYLAAAFSDAIAIYMQSLCLDFDYFDPTLNAQIKESVNMDGVAVHGGLRFRF